MTTFFENPDGPDWFIMFLCATIGLCGAMILISLI